LLFSGATVPRPHACGLPGQADRCRAAQGGVAAGAARVRHARGPNRAQGSPLRSAAARGRTRAVCPGAPWPRAGRAERGGCRRRVGGACARAARPRAGSAAAEAARVRPAACPLGRRQGLSQRPQTPRPPACGTVVSSPGSSEVSPAAHAARVRRPPWQVFTSGPSGTPMPHACGVRSCPRTPRR